MHSKGRHHGLNHLRSNISVQVTHYGSFPCVEKNSHRRGVGPQLHTSSKGLLDDVWIHQSFPLASLPTRQYYVHKLSTAAISFCLLSFHWLFGARSLPPLVHRNLRHFDYGVHGRQRNSQCMEWFNFTGEIFLFTKKGNAVKWGNFEHFSAFTLNNSY